MNSHTKRVKNIFCFFTLLIIFIMNIAMDYKMNTIVIWSILFINIHLLYKYRNNKEFFIVFILFLYFNYSALASQYWFPDFSSIYSGFFQDKIVMNIGINIMFLFWFTIYVFCSTKKLEKYSNFSYGVNIRSNIYLSIFFLLIVLYSIVFKFEIGNIRARMSPIYEYSVMFLLFSYFFSGNKRMIHTVIIFLSLVIVFQNILFGERITALQIILLLYFLYFKNIFSNTLLIICMVGGLFLFTLSGALRGGIVQNVSLFDRIISQFVDSKFILDTAYSAYFTSLTFVKYYFMTSFNEHIVNFIKTLGNYFLGLSVPRLQDITRKYFIHWWGGLLPFTFFYWFGYFGTILSACLVNFYFSFITMCNSSTYKNIVFLYVISTFPRWYLYDPSNLIRGVFLLSICYLFCCFIDNLLQKKYLIV